MQHYSLLNSIVIIMQCLYLGKLFNRVFIHKNVIPDVVNVHLYNAFNIIATAIQIFIWHVGARTKRNNPKNVSV